jgi:hypothetical protein
MAKEIRAIKHLDNSDETSHEDTHAYSCGKSCGEYAGF